MMRALTFAFLFAVTLLARPAAQSLEADLQRAIQRQAVASDLKPVIEDYKRLIARAGSNRAVKAQAMLRLAECYQKLGDVEARKVYEAVVREFGDQSEVVAEARTRLAAARSESPATGSGAATRQLWVGADPMGGPSADGRYLSYTDWDTGDLAIRDLVTNTSRHLTKTGGWNASGDFAEYSMVSPDGRQVAYAWFKDKGAKDQWYDLRVLPVNAAENAAPRMFSSVPPSQWVRPAAWSADGKTLFAIREVDRKSNLLLAVSVADGSARVLKTLPATPQRVAASPDGRYLAYDIPKTDRQGRHIEIMDMNGTSAPLVASAASDLGPLWTADGSHVLFLSSRTGVNALWAVPLRAGKADGGPRLVSTDVTSLPLGITTAGAVLYVKGGTARNVYVAEIDASAKVTRPPVLFTERSLDGNRALTWSADGQSAAYLSMNGVRGAMAKSITIQSLKTGEEREISVRLHIPGGVNGTLRWFPDGRSLLVPSQALADTEVPGGLYRVDVVTGAAEILVSQPTTNNGIRPADLSPDGSSIVYIKDTSVARFDVKTRTETVIKQAGWVGTVAVSPDGTQVAYLGNDQGPSSRTNQIVVVPIAGGDARVLYTADDWYDGSRINALAWTRDQKHLLFVRQEKESDVLWRVPTAGGPAEKTGLQVPGRLKAPQVHPDGRRLAFSTVQNTAAELWTVENFLAPAKK